MRKFTFLLTMLFFGMATGAMAQLNGYYTIKSKATARCYHLYNDAAYEPNTNNLTLQSEADRTTFSNKYIWKVTQDGDVLTLVNGQGTPIKGRSTSTGYNIETHETLTVYSGPDTDGYYVFNPRMDALDDTNWERTNFGVGDYRCVDFWYSGNPSSTSDDVKWQFEAVDATDLYTVEIRGGVESTKITCDNSEISFDGGFIHFDDTKTEANLTLDNVTDKNGSVTIDHTFKTIKVVYSYPNAPIQDGSYLIYCSTTEDNDNEEAKSADDAWYVYYDTNQADDKMLYSPNYKTFIDVECESVSDGNFYYTMKIAGTENVYMYWTGTGDGENVKFEEVSGDIADDNRWRIVVTGDKFNIYPKGGSSALNAYEATDGGAELGLWNDANSNQSKWTFVEGYPVKLHASGIDNVGNLGTFSASETTQIPNGVTAYYAQSIDGTTVALRPIDGNVVPAGEGVILESADATMAVMKPVASTATLSGNQFRNTASAVYDYNESETAYILAGHNNVATFCKLTSGTIATNKAYLVQPAGDEAQVIKMNFGSEATGIESVATTTDVNAPIYDLSGRRVMNAAKGGIYIQNGKKYIVK